MGADDLAPCFKLECHQRTLDSIHNETVAFFGGEGYSDSLGVSLGHLSPPHL